MPGRYFWPNPAKHVEIALKIARQGVERLGNVFRRLKCRRSHLLPLYVLAERLLKFLVRVELNVH